MMDQEEHTERTIRPFSFQGLKKLKRHDLEVERALFQYFPFSSQENPVAKALQDFLAKQFNLESKIQIERMEEGKANEFFRTLSEPCLMAVLGMQPVPAKAYVWIDSVLAATLIDRVLGGSGEIPSEIKSLTPIEEGVFQYLFLKALSEMHQSFGASAPVHFRLERLVKSQKELGSMAQEETSVVILNFRVQVGSCLGFVVVALPHPLIEGIFLARGPLENADWTQEYEYGLKRFDQMGHVQTNLWTEVGSVSLTIAEKNQLEKGDVILFDQSQCHWAGGHLTGNVIVRVGDGKGGGFLAQMVSSEAPVLVKILDYYGGE